MYNRGVQNFLNILYSYVLSILIFPVENCEKITTVPNTECIMEISENKIREIDNIMHLNTSPKQSGSSSTKVGEEHSQKKINKIRRKTFKLLI